MIHLGPSTNALEQAFAAYADGQESIRWPGGRARVAGEAAEIYLDGDWLCISRGHPRFDPRDAERSNDQSHAAAWLDLYRRMGGAEAARKVKGRFAVAIIDRAGHRGFAAVDRFGMESWCYRAGHDSLVLGDRADGLGIGRDAVDPQAVFNYLYFHVVPAPLTVFDGVRRLEGGQCLEWDAGQLSVAHYWLPAFEEPRSLDLEASKRTFLEIVEAATRREAEGHAVGSFLSGGTDSSTVSGMLCRILGKPAPSFSIGFDAEGYDEMEYARIAARHFKTDHHEYYVTPEDLLEGIPAVAAHYDQPFGNSSAVPAFICASKAREQGIGKLLAGDGGDELFGGNTRYAKQRVFGWYDVLPGALRTGLMEPLLSHEAAQKVLLTRKAGSYVEQARVPMPDRLQMYNLMRRIGFDELLAPAFLARVDPELPTRQQRETWQAAKARSLINRMLAFDFKYTLADNDLPKVIGSSSLASVAVGFPLLSDELLDFSVGLPPEWKLKGLKLRWFFKEALKGFLPPEILVKKKHGFGLPFGVWVGRHDGLRTMAVQALGRLKQRDIVRPEFIDRLVTELLPAHPSYFGELVWILLMLELWLEGAAL
ncbi:MAG: asparagine synthase [Rhodocyclaceae bacterium]|nr:asparagine synthase [Rhodocyclaceae bacterium]